MLAQVRTHLHSITIPCQQSHVNRTSISTPGSCPLATRRLQSQPPISPSTLPPLSRPEPTSDTVHSVSTLLLPHLMTSMTLSGFRRLAVEPPQYRCYDYSPILSLINNYRRRTNGSTLRRHVPTGSSHRTLTDANLLHFTFSSVPEPSSLYVSISFLQTNRMFNLRISHTCI